MQTILTELTVNITELKQAPSKILKEANGAPVTILNKNKPVAYLVPLEAFERMYRALSEANAAKIKNQTIDLERED